MEEKGYHGNAFAMPCETKTDVKLRRRAAIRPARCDAITERYCLRDRGDGISNLAAKPMMEGPYTPGVPLDDIIGHWDFVVPRRSYVPHPFSPFLARGLF